MTTVGIAALGNSLTAQPFLTTCPTCHRFKICGKSTILFYFFKLPSRTTAAAPPTHLAASRHRPAGPNAGTPGAPFHPSRVPQPGAPRPPFHGTARGRAPGGLRAEAARPQVCPCHRAVPEPPAAACGEGGQGVGVGGASGGDMGWGRQRPSPCSGTEGTATGSGGPPCGLCPPLRR